MTNRLSRNGSRCLLAACLSMLACACGEDNDAGLETDLKAACKDQKSPAVELFVDTGFGDQPLDSDVLVSGRTRQANQFAVREVLVDGLPATKEAFNYSSWSAVVPVARLLPQRDESGAAAIEVVARDACGGTASQDIVVNLLAPVRELNMDVDFPGGEVFLPADGRTAAVVTVTSNAEAAGARVELSASGSGSFVGLINGGATLGGDGSAPASVSLLFSASQAGTVFVSATSQGQLASAPILVAAAPRVRPSSADLAPGQSLSVTVDSEGRIESCQATPTAGLTVTSEGRDLAAGPVEFDDAQRISLVVSAGDTLTEEQTVNVTCRDPFGQSGTGEFTAAP